MNFTFLHDKWTRGRKNSMSIDQELFDAIVDEVKTDDDTLEFGSGLSTWAFAGGRSHLAIEQDYTQSKEFPEAVYLPISQGWYDFRPRDTYRVILVDGPYGGDRYKGLDTILKCCQEDTVVFIDDTHRETEELLAETLAEILAKPLRFTRTATRQFARIG